MRVNATSEVLRDYAKIIDDAHDKQVIMLSAEFIEVLAKRNAELEARVSLLLGSTKDFEKHDSVRSDAVVSV